MTDKQHPITPPPELAKQWLLEGPHPWHEYVATQAANWGADQELEACCRWLAQEFPREAVVIRQLRTARRPKPPSLKEQALEELEKWREVIGVPQLDTIRCALEQLDE